MNEEDVLQVINRLYPGREYTSSKAYGEEWGLEHFTFFPDKPETSHLSQAEFDACQAEFDANLYARNRKEEFRITLGPTVQADMRYHDDMDGTTTLKDAITAIKAKWPKDNSGPIE